MVGQPQARNDGKDHRNPPSKRAPIVRILRVLKAQLYRDRSGPKKGETDHQKNERMMAHWTQRVGIFTFFLVVISGISAAIFYLQFQAMKADQRPWIGLGDIIPLTSPTAPSGPAVAYQLSFRNGGKSPALKTDILITGGAGDCSKYAIPHRRCEGDKCTLHNIVLLPGNSMGTQVPKNEEPPLPPRSEVCLIGRVDYEDADGAPHKTGICLIYSPVRVQSCPEPDSNYAD